MLSTPWSHRTLYCKHTGTVVTYSVGWAGERPAGVNILHDILLIDQAEPFVNLLFGLVQHVALYVQKKSDFQLKTTFLLHRKVEMLNGTSHESLPVRTPYNI